MSLYRDTARRIGYIVPFTGKKRKFNDSDDDEDEDLIVEEEPCTNIYSVCDVLGLFKKIVDYLNVHERLKVKESCFTKQLSQKNGRLSYWLYGNDLIYNTKILFDLYRRYERKFPRGTELTAGQIPTLFICACEHGRMVDVELFVNLHPFHKYIANRDVNGYRDDMTLKDMVNQVGRNSRGGECTPLMIAAKNEHFQIVKYLIEQGEADPNIANSRGYNALHYAAGSNETNTELIELLLTHMTLNSINKKTSWWGATPLDYAYRNYNSPIQQEIIALLRSKGGYTRAHRSAYITGNVVVV